MVMDIPRLCEHLEPLVRHLVESGVKATYAGQVWSTNCRMWVYFDVELDMEGLRRLVPARCVEEHVNEDERSGRERGFVCAEHHDGVMGKYPRRG
jgi:hypothetical protein